MPKKKRRTKRPRDPCNFSIRLEKENLGRLQSIHEGLKLDNRNQTINAIIETYSRYHDNQGYLDSLKQSIQKGVQETIRSREFRKILREQIRAEIIKIKRRS